MRTHSIHEQIIAYYPKFQITDSPIFAILSYFCQFYALLYGEVIVVTPIVSTVPLFAMLTAVLFRVERITGRIVLAVLIVIAGVAVVSFGRTS